ncbi:hypothetical protein [Brevundimonas sp.]
MECDVPRVSTRELVASRAEQLQRITDAGLVAQGRVFLLSLEPIKLQIGAKWSARSEVIWDAVERALDKSMPSPDVYLRLNDTSVLVAIASTDSYEGQVRCVEVLRTLLSYFLGRSADADIALSRISSIADGEISAEHVDIAAPPRRPIASLATDPPTRSPEHWIPPLTERISNGTLSLTHYGESDYRIDVVPVWRLDRETISAYAIRMTLPAGRDHLSDRDREALTALTIEHTLPILDDYRKEGGTFALILPMSFSALSARRPRLALLSRCSPFKDVMQRAVIAELTDLDAGIPSGLIRETAAMIKPFFRVLTATVSTSADVSAVYRETAFHGLAIRWRSRQIDDLAAVLRTAGRRTRNLMVHIVPDDISAHDLKAIGATHITWDRGHLR